MRGSSVLTPADTVMWPYSVFFAA